jgi:hypothetical protein
MTPIKNRELINTLMSSAAWCLGQLDRCLEDPDIRDDLDVLGYSLLDAEILRSELRKIGTASNRQNRSISKFEDEIRQRRFTRVNELP